MYGTTLQSLCVLLVLLALAFSPIVYLWARRRDADPQPASPAPADPTQVPGVMSPREAVAHHLYGQAVGWAPQAMADYDASPVLQGTWLIEADIALHSAHGYRRA